MQVTTVSSSPSYPQDNGQAAGEQVKSGDFDLVMSMVCALIAPSPSNMAQGQLNSLDGKTNLAGPSVLNLADPAVLLNGPEAALTEKEPVGGIVWPQPADIGDTGDVVHDGAQIGVEDTMLNNLLTASVLQRNPVPVMSLFQNSQTPINQSTIDGGAFQQVAVPDAEAAIPNAQAVSVQLRAGIENTRGDSPVFLAALQPEPGVIPKEVQPFQKTAEIALAAVSASQQGVQSVQTVQAPVGTEPSSGLSQQGIQLFPENSPAEKKENKAAQDVGLMETLSLNNALQGGRENESGTGKIKAVNMDNETGLIRAGGKTKTSDLPQGNTAQPNTAQFDVTPSNPLQPEPGSSTQSTGDVAKGVTLPDLKERLIQEIRHIFTTHKGEPQTQVQLKLEPEHLGQLTIKLFFNRGELSAHFYTGNSHVKEILEGSMQQLRDILGQQDLRLNEALVFTGNDGSGGMGRYFDERNGRGASSYGGYNHRLYGDSPVEPVDLVSTQSDSSRVNYLI